MFIPVGTLLTEVKSCKVGEVTGFGNEKNFTEVMLKQPNCVSLKGGTEVMKWKQQMRVVYFGKFAVKILG